MVAKTRATACDYECMRNARLLENQARLESLGLIKIASELRQQAAEKKRKATRPWIKKVYGLAPLRRSHRLNPSLRTDADAYPDPAPLPRRSRRFRSTPEREKVSSREGEEEEEEEVVRAANAPLVKLSAADLRIAAENSAKRCNSKGRGGVFNPVLGICCHFCRQKKLCGEEDCKRCGNFDVDEPCLGKTDCSVCHSSTGVFCRACLMARYGEDIEEVRKNKEWMCPHCIEAKGINRYWICNSSICLRKQKRAPTGIAFYRAREMGYKSVAHLLMDQLKYGKKC